MRPRTLLILLVLVLGLGAFVWFYERELPSSEERVEQAKKVLTFEKDDVRKVSLETPSGRVVFERIARPEGETKNDEKDENDEKSEEEEAPGEEALGEPESEWKITAPLQARADPFAVDGLLESLSNLEKTRTLEDVSRKDVGLEKPRATVRIESEEGTQVLQLGTAVPTGGALIAGLEGEQDTAYVVSDTIWSQLDRDPGSWRDRQLFRASRDAIARIALTGPDGQRIVLAQKDGRFRIESPFADRADKTLVDDLYADLSGLTAEEFLDKPQLAPAAMGLQPPQRVVEVTFQTGDPLRIELGAPTSPAPEPPADPSAPPPPTAVYARLGPQLLATRTRLPQTAAHPPADWRARSLSAFEVHEIEAATLGKSPADANSPLRLTRAGTDWKRGAETISYLPVSDFLFALTEAQADRLLTPQEAGPLGQPVLTVELDAKQAGKERLTLYPARPDGVPAQVSGRDVVLLLPKDKLQEIQARLGDVRGAKKMEGEAGKAEE
jgi:hypothetical protein